MYKNNITNNVYIAHTPYHILLSCGLALLNNKTQSMNYLIIVYDFGDAHKIYEVLKEWTKNPFSVIELIPGIYDLKKEKRLSSFIHKSNVNYLQKFINQISTEEALNIFCFNDHRVEDQILLYIRAVKYSGINYYVEDGNAVYQTYTYPKQNIFLTIFHMLFYGIYYKHVKVLGTYKYINKCLLFYPQLCRKELKDVNKYSLKVKILTDIDKEFIYDLYEKYAEKRSIKKYQCILVLPHSDFLKRHNVDKFKVLLKRILDIVTSKYSFIGVKFHPRESNFNLFSINKYQNVEYLPTTLPIEVIWLLLKDQPPSVVIGDISTSLISGNFVLQETTFISIIKIISNNVDPTLLNLFINIGIIVPQSLSEIDECI